MALFTFGINHATAPLEIREKVAFGPDIISDALNDARSALRTDEVAILSTCNRTEIYVSPAAPVEPLLHWLASYHQLPPTDLEKCHYAYRGEDAIRHMMRVACGLDSLILGEPQILGQMKSAYAVARDAGTVGSRLHNTFQQVFAIAKRVRTETAIGENPVSVAFAAVSLAQQIFSDLREDTALLIGAGETIELVARHLRHQGVTRLIVANRTLGRAREVAGHFDAQAILLSDIPEHLHRADIVISSTASPLPLLGKGTVESALKRRKHKPMFMVDIAVPRDIEPQVGDLDDVYLYTVDDLRQVIDQGRRSRQAAAEKAGVIVDEGVSYFQSELRALESVNTIKAYRQKAHRLAEAELHKAQRAIARGEDVQKVLQQLSRGLVNKLTHTPTTKLKEAGAAGRKEIITLTRELFDINELDTSDNHE
ncbi:glutamyl-tRNA reductase [Gilvimarinus sp. F26214L]|uniref:glutamyl-tRNA reductase n=1 Tax=Gilvimarinus sp. DZF01 TaxID=3461371 RepID=UPI004045BB3B